MMSSGGGGGGGGMNMGSMNMGNSGSMNMGGGSLANLPPGVTPQVLAQYGIDPDHLTNQVFVANVCTLFFMKLNHQLTCTQKIKCK